MILGLIVISYANPETNVNGRANTSTARQDSIINKTTAGLFTVGTNPVTPISKTNKNNAELIIGVIEKLTAGTIHRKHLIDVVAVNVGSDCRSRRILFVIDTSGSMKEPIHSSKGTPTGLSPEELATNPGAPGIRENAGIPENSGIRENSEAPDLPGIPDSPGVQRTPAGDFSLAAVALPADQGGGGCLLAVSDSPGGFATERDPENGRTRLRVICVYPSAEIRDMVLNSGMTRGAALSYDRLRSYRTDLMRALYSKVQSGVESPQAFAAYARSLKLVPAPGVLTYSVDVLQAFVRDVLLTLRPVDAAFSRAVRRSACGG